ncbi:MAG: hypothetical protein FGM14_07240 [Flavobacteriales bacterium]|nr:hypothetical protein [Flavobacteriales bacterium]
MNRNYFIIIVSVLIFISCNSKKEITYTQIRNEYNTYRIFGKKSKLRKSYNLLIVNEDFKKNKITPKNFDLAIPILIDMEKYDFLKNLLKQSNSGLSDYHLEFYNNHITGLKYQCKDSIISNKSFNKNLIVIKNQIDFNIKDSTLLFDYFITKLYLSDINSVLKEVDLLKTKNKNFSIDFYDKVLKETIEEYSLKIRRC